MSLPQIDHPHPKTISDLRDPKVLQFEVELTEFLHKWSHVVSINVIYFMLMAQTNMIGNSLFNETRSNDDVISTL